MTKAQKGKLSSFKRHRINDRGSRISDSQQSLFPTDRHSPIASPCHTTTPARFKLKNKKGEKSGSLVLCIME